LAGVCGKEKGGQGPHRRSLDRNNSWFNRPRLPAPERFTKKRLFEKDFVKGKY